MSRTDPEQIEEIRSWGRDRAVPAGRSLTTAAPGTAGPSRRVVFMGD